MSFGGTTFGGATFGGTSSLSTSVFVTGIDISITIAGVDYTDNLLLGTLQVTDELNSRNTCQFSLTDFTKTLHLVTGELVRVTYRGALLFAGTVDQVSEQVPSDVSDVLIVNVECVDFNQLLDRHVIANKWAPGQLFYLIITQTLNTFSDIAGGTDTLTAEGITASENTVEQEPRLQTVVANYNTVTEFFNDLADLTGYYWFVDYNKVLYFVDRTKFVAPYALDDNVWQQYRGLSVSRSRDEYRNVQYLRAGKDETAVGGLQKNFQGDGKETSFTVDLEISRQPTITLNAGAQTVGIRQKDTGKNWYYEVGEKEITQDSSGTKLTSGDTLNVTYTGFFKIVSQGRDSQEVLRRQAIEGGTGVYVNIESDDKIDDNELSKEKVAGLLRKFGRIQNEIEFETDVDGFRSGQLLTVNLPDHGLAGQYLINGVDLEVVSNSFIRYKVSAISGEHVGTWVDFFRRNAAKGRPFVYNENEKLELLRQEIDTFFLSDNLSTTSPQIGYASDNSSYWVVGVTPIGRRGQSVITDAALNGNYYGPLVGRPLIVP